MSSEATLLLKFVSPETSREEIFSSIRGSDMEWGRLLELAVRHQMVGIAAPRLLENAGDSMPDNIRNSWGRRWQSLAERDAAQWDALEKILGAASSFKLTPMLLKGLAVHLQAYEEGTARGASDIDLLVRVAEAPVAARLLEGLGFVPLSDWPTLIKRTNGASFSHPDGVSVDLHWSVCAPVEEWASGLKFTDHLWTQWREISIGEFPCRIPGREEELLVLCVNLLKGSPFLLRTLSDLVHLLCSHDSVDWQRLLSLARATGAGPILYYAFELIHAAAPERVPLSVRAELACFGGTRWLFSPFLRLEQLAETQGQELTHLALRWKGVLFSRRLWAWVPYQAALHGKRFLR